MSLQRVQIVTVDPATRYVEFKLKDQVVVSTQVWEIPSFFRWPKQGEYWTVERTGNTWKLGERMEDVHTVKPVTEVAAGEAKINTDRVIYTDDGARMAVVVGNPAQGDTLTWNVPDNAWIPGSGGGGGGLEVDFYNAPYDGPDDPTAFPGTTLMDFAAGGFNIAGFGGGEILVNSATKPFYLPYGTNYVGALPRGPLENASGGITYIASGIIDTSGWDGLSGGNGTDSQTLSVNQVGSAISLPIGSYFYATRMTTGTVTINNGGSGWQFILPGSVTPVTSFTIAKVGGLVKVQRITDALWLVSGDASGGGIAWYDFTSNLYPVGASDWAPGFSGAPQIGVANGVIFLRGSIELIGASGQGVTIVDSPVGALPAAYRPTANRFMTFFTSTFSDDPTEVGWQGTLRLGSDGHLKLYTTLSSLIRNGARRPTSGFQPQDTILFDGLCCAV